MTTVEREDGWAYVGVGEDGKDVFAKGYGVKQWKEAMNFAARKGAHLGSDAELDLLQTTLNKGLLKDSFDLSGSNPSGWVWGSRMYPFYPDYGARVQSLSGGGRGWSWQVNDASTVLFRSEPRPGA